MTDLAYDHTPRAAIATLTEDARAAWRGRYCLGEGAELRALGLLERTERDLRAAGAEATIYGVWVALVDRADTPDKQAAAALAGKALGLVGVG